MGLSDSNPCPDIDVAIARGIMLATQGTIKKADTIYKVRFLLNFLKGTQSEKQQRSRSN